MLSPVVEVSDSGFFSFSSELLNLSTIPILGWTVCFRRLSRAARIGGGISGFCLLDAGSVPSLVVTTNSECL